jgi:hypothetical protein
MPSAARQKVASTSTWLSSSLPVGLPVRKVVSYTLQLKKRRKGDASFILSRVRIKKKERLSRYTIRLRMQMRCKRKIEKKKCGVTQHAVGQSVSQSDHSHRSLLSYARSPCRGARLPRAWDWLRGPPVGHVTEVTPFLPWSCFVHVLQPSMPCMAHQYDGDGWRA